MIRPVTGSFLEIEHPNRAERIHTHEALCAFTADAWQSKVRELHALGMDTLVLLSTALRGQAFFPFDGFPFPDYLSCADPIGAILTAADSTGQQVYLGVGYYGTNDSVGNTTDPHVIRTALLAMERLFALYGHHPSFVGWYVSDEWCLWDHFDERFIRYINTVSRHAKSLCAAHRTILAPFGTYCLQADDVFASQLERIDADAIAYQDEVGVRRLTPEALAARFEALHKVHRQAGRASLWADTEIFDFEGDPYKSALIPAPFSRVRAQIEAVSPFVEKILVYTAQGLLESPGSAAPLGGKEAHTLYTVYEAWRHETVFPLSKD